MVMTRHFAGNSMGTLDRSGSGVAEVTTASTFNSTYAINSVQVPGSGAYVEAAGFTESTTLWAQCDYYPSWTGFAGSSVIEWLNGSANGYRLKYDNFGAVTAVFEYWNGSAWVSAGGSTVSLTQSALTRITLKLIFGTSWTLYIDGAQITTGALAGGPSTITKMRGFNGTNGGNAYFSRFMIANDDIRTHEYFCRYASGNGNETDGTGTYTDINETVYNEATSINLPALTDQKTFTKASITVPAGYKVGCMVVGVRGAYAAPASNAKALIRSGGTTYSSANIGIGAAYGSKQYRAENDPATGLPWTETNINNAEFGVEAA